MFPIIYPSKLEEGVVFTIHIEMSVKRNEVPEDTIHVEYVDGSVDVPRPEDGGTFSDMVEENEALAELLEDVNLSEVTIIVNDDVDRTIEENDEVPEDAITLSITEDEEDDSDEDTEEEPESSDETA